MFQCSLFNAWVNCYGACLLCVTAFHSHLIGRFPCLHGSGSFITLLLSEDIQCTEENSEDTVLAKERQTKEQGYGCRGYVTSTWEIPHMAIYIQPVRGLGLK